MPESKITKRTIAVDFDGVIHSYVSGWQGLVPTDPPREGALEFINALLAEDFTVVVHTARANDLSGQIGVIGWLHRYGFPELDITANKPAAIAYVDDRAVYAGAHASWTDVMSDITHREREHRRS